MFSLPDQIKNRLQQNKEKFQKAKFKQQNVNVTRAFSKQGSRYVIPFIFKRE